jgi:hypothetical protein
MNKNTELLQYTLTKHAIERFNERNPSKNDISEISEQLIQRLLKNAYSIKFSPTHQVVRLLNNKIKEVKYLYCSGWIFVCGDNNIIVTIERQDDKKFGKDIFRTE